MASEDMFSELAEKASRDREDEEKLKAACRSLPKRLHKLPRGERFPDGCGKGTRQLQAFGLVAGLSIRVGLSFDIGKVREALSGTLASFSADKGVDAIFPPSGIGEGRFSCGGHEAWAWLGPAEDVFCDMADWAGEPEEKTEAAA